MTRAPAAGMAASGTTRVVPEPVVEPDGQLAGQLEVLALVVADRHPLGVVEQDVGRLEHRVGEQAHPDRVLAGALVLELGHPAQLAHGGRALEQPGHLGVLGHVALDEEGAPLGVEAGGQQVEGGLRRSGSAGRRGRCRGSGRAGPRCSRRRRGRPGRPPSCAGHPGSSPGGGRRWAAGRTELGTWGVIVGRARSGRSREVHEMAPLQPVGSVPWPPPSPPRSSRVRSTSCCSWSTATRSSSTTSPWPRWWTPSWPRWPAGSRWTSRPSRSS